MLSLFFAKFSFKRAVKSGFYVDFMSRYVASYGIQNLFIWGSLYLSEKFIIEYTTRFSNITNQQTFLTGNNPVSIFQLTFIWGVISLICSTLI